MTREKLLINFLRSKLRRASYAWPPRKNALKAGRVSRGKYKCAKCENIFGPKEISLDHIDPVIDPHVGFVDWNTFIDRLFCDIPGWQILCDLCHDAKTAVEQAVRNEIKEEKKVPKKKASRKKKK